MLASFALGGLALATSGRTARRALPLAAAVTTKQSYLVAPLCVLLALAATPWIVAFELLAGSLLVVAGVGTWLTGNELLWHTVVANANPLDLDHFEAMLGAFAQFNALPLVAASALFGLPARPAERLWQAYFVRSFQV
jgi:hypothetical protein